MKETKNEVATQNKQNKFTTDLSKWSNEITRLIARDYEACGMQFDDYSRKCALEAMTSIFILVKTSPKLKDLNDLNRSNLRAVVEHCASLKLNASAYPKECYFQLRNVKIGIDEQGKDVWQQQVEMGIEGAGNDTILSNFGKDVDRVYPYWVIKEGDTYVPPKHKGLEITPPEWEENGLSDKTVRVVYPVKLTDGTVTYLSADRNSVKVNLLAHVRQNMMNKTFGIVKGTVNKYGKEIARTCYDATEVEKKQIDAKKKEVLDALRECETVDDMLKCEIAKPFMSDAWLDTPESMITRKMCNNATKKYPKNYDPMAKKSYIELDDTYQHVQEEISNNANTVEFIEQTEEVIDEPKKEDVSQSEPEFMKD